MTGTRRIARRYARALFVAANNNKQVHEVEHDLNMVREIFSKRKKLYRFLFNPTIDSTRKLEFVRNVLGDKIAPLVLELFRLMLEKRRELAFELIYQEFAKLRREQEKVVFVQVHSAKKMSEEEKNSLIQKIEKDTGSKIEAKFDVDKDLVAGIKIRYNNYVIDGSVKNGLRRMRDMMIYHRLKQA